MDGVYDVLGVCLFDFPLGLVVLTSFPLNQRTNLPRDHKQTTSPRASQKGHDSRESEHGILPCLYPILY